MKTLCFFLILLSANLFSIEATKIYDINYVREFVYIGAGKIEIKQSDRNRLILKGEEPLIANVLLDDGRGILSLSPKDPFCMGRYPGIVTGVLEVKDLNKITLNGSIAIDVDHFKTDELTIIMLDEGSSLFEGVLEVQNLSLKIEGSSEAVIKGQANTQSVFLTGSGIYDGQGFETKISTIHISGAGTALVYATELLNGFILGYGHIHYVGTPNKINQRVSGDGKLTPYTPGMKR